MLLDPLSIYLESIDLRQLDGLAADPSLFEGPRPKSFDWWIHVKLFQKYQPETDFSEAVQAYDSLVERIQAAYMPSSDHKRGALSNYASL